jgi:hypothetical protein
MPKIRRGVIHGELRGAVYVFLFYALAVFPGWFFESAATRAFAFAFGAVLTSIIMLFHGRIRSVSEETDPAQSLLPVEFRRDWRAIPRDYPIQVFVIGIVTGIAATLTSIGIILHNESLFYVPIPVGMLVIIIQNRIIPWPEKRRVKEIESPRIPEDAS